MPHTPHRPCPPPPCPSHTHCPDLHLPFAPHTAWFTHTCPHTPTPHLPYCLAISTCTCHAIPLYLPAWHTFPPPYLFPFPWIVGNFGLRGTTSPGNLPSPTPAFPPVLTPTQACLGGFVGWHSFSAHSPCSLFQYPHPRYLPWHAAPDTRPPPPRTAAAGLAPAFAPARIQSLNKRPYGWFNE